MKKIKLPTKAPRLNKLALPKSKLKKLPSDKVLDSKLRMSLRRY